MRDHRRPDKRTSKVHRRVPGTAARSRGCCAGAASTPKGPSRTAATRSARVAAASAWLRLPTAAPAGARAAPPRSLLSATGAAARAAAARCMIEMPVTAFATSDAPLDERIAVRIRPLACPSMVASVLPDGSEGARTRSRPTAAHPPPLRAARAGGSGCHVGTNGRTAAACVRAPAGRARTDATPRVLGSGAGCCGRIMRTVRRPPAAAASGAPRHSTASAA